jgi:hypothetical protein
VAKAKVHYAFQRGKEEMILLLLLLLEKETAE